VAAILLASALVQAPLRGDTTWDGSSGTNWFTSANWSAGVPDENDDVTIPAGLSNYPVLNANGAICRDLIIASGATLTLSTYTITIADDFAPGATNVLPSSTGQLNFQGSGLVLPEIQGAITFSGDIRINRSGFFDWVTVYAAVSCDDLIVDDGILLLTNAGGTYTHVFDDVTVASGATLDRVNATLDIGDDVSNAGTWDDSDADGGTFVGGDWTDTGTFTTGTQTVTFDGGGTSLITVPDSSDFHGITITGSTTARTTTAIDINGTLTINSGSLFDADGDIDVTGGAVTCSGTGKLEVSSSLTSLGTFTAGTGTVEYNSTSANQTVYPATYYDLEIDKGSTTGTVSGDLTVTHAMTIVGGTLDVNGGFDATGATVGAGPGRLQLGGTVTSLGTFTAGTSTVEYDSTAANQAVAGVTYYDLEIDKGTFTASAGSTATVGNMLTITSGTLDITSSGDITATGAVSVSGTLRMTDAGDLRLGTSVTVNSGGTFVTSGSSRPTVTNDGSGDYTFTISSGATVEIRGLNMANVESTGLTIADGATIAAIRNIAFTSIDPDSDGSNDTFLRVLGTGSAEHSFVNLSFDSSCTYNVSTASGTAVNILMVVPSGAKGTEAYESEGTAGSIDWPAFTRVWVGGASGTPNDWDVAANWSPTTVPGPTDDCLIPDVTSDPILNVDGDVHSIYIDDGGSLTIASDWTMQLKGDLIITSAGTFDMTDGALLFDGTAGQHIDDEGGSTTTVHDLIVDKSSGTFSPTADISATGDLTVTAGTFGIDTNTVTVAGSVDIDGTVTIVTGTLDANGSFDATGGAVTFSGSGRLELGSAVTSLGTFTANASTVRYDDTGSDRTAASASYQNLEIVTSTRTVTAGGSFTVAGSLTVTSGTFATGANTVTVTGASDVDGTLAISTGLFDANGSFDGTGGAVAFSGAGRLQLGSAVTALGTLTPSTGTVEFDDTSAGQTIPATTYYGLEIDKGSTTATVSGALTVTGALTISGGTLDVNGAFDATGATVNAGSGRIQLGGAVTSLGAFTAGTSTVEYDNTAANQTVAAVTYYDLEIDNGIRVALTGGNVTVSDDLSILTGELEVDDGDVLRVDDDVSVAGLLDIEPGSELRLAAATALTVSGDFEAIGGASDIAHITSSDTSTPGRYSFAIVAGGQITANHALFEYMDASGIQITDDSSVQAIAQIDDVYFGNGASGGVLLSVTSNGNAVTLAGVNFEDNNGNLAYNVSTTGSTATITIDPYGGDFGGPAHENDDGSGTVTPGTIAWGAYSPARLVSFEATAVGRGVLLEWGTAAEWRSLGYALERSLGGSAFAPVGPALIPSTGIPPAGDRYRFLDDTPGAAAGATYRLVEIDLRGARTVLARATARLARTGRSVGAAAALIASSAAAPSLSAPLLPSAATRRAGTPHAIVPAAPLPTAGISALTSSTAPAAPPISAVRIRVEPEGVVRLEHSALAAAGFPVGVDPDRFLLERDGAPWPIALLDGGDGSFDPGDAIDFVPAPFSHPETRFDTYILGIAPPGSGSPRIPELAGTPSPSIVPIDASIVTEILASQDLYVLALADGAGRDHFFDEVLAAPGSLSIPISLDSAIAAGEPVIVEIALEGWSDDPLSPLDHCTRVFWDGSALGVLSSDGSGPYGGAFEVPPALSASGPHDLVLEQELLGLPDVVFLDRVEVTYLRENRARADRLAIDVADPVVRIDGFTAGAIEVYRADGAGAPERILGGAAVLSPAGEWSLTFAAGAPGRFEAFASSAARVPVEIAPAAPPRTLDPPRGADWLAIAPEAFHAELAPLAALRRAQGLRAEVISLEEVHDRFGGGRPTTDSIERFLRHARARWRAPAPSFVLLVGDATYDPAGHLGPSPRQVLPTPLIEVGGIQTASDAQLVDANGDGTMDVAIGRFPVATAAECHDLVQKTIAYETARGPSPPQQVLFVADDDSDFEGSNAALESLLPPAVGAVHLDLAAIPLAPLRAALIGPEWADATAVLYTGHGSRLQFADEGILLVGDVPALPADPRPPVVVAMNCWNGFFQHPLTPSLGEALLLAPDRGAIAYFGPSAVTTTIGQQALAEELAARLFAAPRTRLGEAILAAERALAGDPAVADVLATWTLLGDPALIVR